MLEVNKIHHGDCLELMKEIPDNSIDLVLTSPPYNMNLRISNGKYCSRQITKELTTKYDGFDDNLPMEEYFNFNRNVINECLRVSDIVFYNVQFLTGNKRALFKIIGYFSDYLKEFIIWDKLNAEPAICDGVLNSRFEVIFTFDKKNAISRRFEKCGFDRGTVENLWQIKKQKSICSDHKATFPESLCEKIIGNFTYLKDVVLDPFAGTGTTATVCNSLKRKFIGIEINKKYVDIANKRISKVQQKLF